MRADMHLPRSRRDARRYAIWLLAVVMLGVGCSGDEDSSPDTSADDTSTTEPPESYTTMAMPAASSTTLSPGATAALVGQACSPDGSTVAGFEAPAYGSDLQGGLRCMAGVWSAVGEIGGSCAFESIGPWVLADGAEIMCANGRLAPPGPLQELFVGNYVVGTGTGQVAPGTYEAFDVTDCYWERVDANGEIIDNNFVTAAPRAEFTVEPTDAGLNIDGCGGWKRVG